MNYRIVIYTVGKTIALEGAIMVIPAIISLIYNETATPFVITFVICELVAAFMIIAGQKNSERLYTREGFAIVTLTWVFMSLLGALPFFISGYIPSYIDAVFESVSGFTTTGASILTNVEALSKGMLFWRSSTHWIGGMGVLVFILAIAERNPNRSINIMKAEMPGSKVDKLKPKAKSTAIILYKIYCVMTVLEIVLLLAGGMPLYDSIVHSLGTAGTGGFGIYNDSLGSFNPYLQYIVATFTILFAINFSLYFLLIRGKFRTIFKSNELKWFASIIVVAIAIIVVSNQNLYTSGEENFRSAYFQVASIISTTGYSTCDFNQWTGMAKAVLFMLMFIGGCEGSTAGGLKVSRIMIIAGSIRNELRRSLHQRAVTSIKIGGKTVDRETVTGVCTYLGLYLFIGIIALIIISLDSFDLETNLSAVVACLNNIGPGFAGVGPASNFAAYSDMSKIVLSSIMLLGRLEIYPIISLGFQGKWF